jgi:hypothetical protein
MMTDVLSTNRSKRISSEVLSGVYWYKGSDSITDNTDGGNVSYKSVAGGTVSLLVPKESKM